MDTQIHLRYHCPKTPDELVPLPAGLYCGACDKTVMDLSALSKPQIIRELTRHEQTPCVILPEEALSAPTASGATPSFRKPVSPSAETHTAGIRHNGKLFSPPLIISR